MLRLLTLCCAMLAVQSLPVPCVAQKKPATTSGQKATTPKKPAPTTRKAAPAKAPAASKPAAAKKPAATKAAPAAASPQRRTLSRAEYERQQRDLQRQIESTQRMINDNDKSVRSQRRDIQLRAEEIGKRRALITSMQREIDAIRADEDSLQRTLVQLRASYRTKQAKYKAAVRHLYKWRSGYDELLFVLSAHDMMEGVRRARYLRQYSAWRKAEGEALNAERQRTERAQAELRAVKADRERLLASIEQERQSLQAQQDTQNKNIASLQRRGKELQRELERDRKRQAEIQRQIQRMVDEERRKAAAAAGKPSGNAATPSNTTSEATTRLTGTFRQNKGKMPYPVDSNFAFLQHYRQKSDGNLSIRLSTSTTANACSIFDGRVTRCSRSNEEWTVIVSHGEYMSVYSNLQNVSVKEGEQVKMRQPIGRIKPDPDGGRGELMFWIYGKSDAENPELWLRK